MFPGLFHGENAVSEPDVTTKVTTAVNAAESKAGNEIDAVLKPKITVPVWALLVAFAIGQAVALFTHV